MIPNPTKKSEEAFHRDVAGLVRLLEARLCGGNRPELQVELNGAADRVADAVRRQVRTSETYYLPILKGLAPVLEERFQVLTWEHDALTSMADEMASHVREGRPVEAVESLCRISRLLEDHEHHQEDAVSEFLNREGGEKS